MLDQVGDQFQLHFQQKASQKNNDQQVVRANSFRLVIKTLCSSDRRKDFEQALTLLNRMKDLELPLDGASLAAIHKS